MLEFLVGIADDGITLFKFCKKYLKNASLSRLYAIFRKKDIKVNGKHAKRGEVLHSGDKISIYGKDVNSLVSLKEDEKIIPKPLPFPIIYEDDNILVVDKPKGILSQKDKKDVVSLVEHVNAYLSFKKIDAKAYPIHRLDNMTSGVSILAKNYHAARVLSSAFLDHENVEKIYIALCFGIAKDEGDIKKKLKKDDKINFVRIDENGKDAFTHYRLIRLFDEQLSLLEIHLFSGRTHQIRVHLASESLPIVNDEKYGDFSKNKSFQKKYHDDRLFLHAKSICFKKIDDDILKYLEGKKFISPLPKVEANVLKLLEEV